MPRDTLVYPQDRDLIRHLAYEIKEAMDKSGTPPSAADGGCQLAARLKSLAERGDLTAERALYCLGVDGAVRFMRDCLKEDRQTATVAYNGDIIGIDMPGRYAITPKGTDGKRLKDDDGRPVPRQYWLFLDMRRNDYFRMVDALDKQRETIAKHLVVLTKLTALLRKYPEAETARDACALEGIDPETLELDA